MSDEGLVVGGVHEHVDERVVLGGGANHGGAADVDVLDALRKVAARRDGLAERVEVDCDDVDVADVVLLDGLDVGLEVAAREDAAVHRRVESLDPAVEHLGEAGDLVDGGDLDAHVRDGLGASAGGDDLVAERAETLGEVGHARLIGDGDERAGLGAVGGLGLRTLAHIASDVLLACEFSGEGGVMGFGQRRFDAIASRAWRLRCAPRSPLDPAWRSNAIPEGYRIVEKVPIVLTAAAACGGWGEDWRRAGSRACRFDGRTGAGGGPDGYTRHRDRGADSGGRHGDGRRRLGSQWLPGETH